MESGDAPTTHHASRAAGPVPSIIDLSVEGMHCQSCVLLVEETLGDLPAVDQVAVDLDAARATVSFDSGGISVDALCAAVTGLGYPTSPLVPGGPGGPGA